MKEKFHSDGVQGMYGRIKKQRNKGKKIKKESRIEGDRKIKF